MEHKKIKLSKLVANNGQIEGVPKNPRQWTKDDVEKLKASIEETTELLEARGCIVYPLGDKFVVLGGNMRLTACKQLGHKEVDCVVLDVFGGSGTTLIAAEQLGRKAYLMELDPHYCDVIIARWEKLTGKTAIKIS